MYTLKLETLIRIFEDMGVQKVELLDGDDDRIPSEFKKPQFIVYQIETEVGGLMYCVFNTKTQRLKATYYGTSFKEK